MTAGNQCVACYRSSSSFSFSRSSFSLLALRLTTISTFSTLEIMFQVVYLYCPMHHADLINSLFLQSPVCVIPCPVLKLRLLLLQLWIHQVILVMISTSLPVAVGVKQIPSQTDWKVWLFHTRLCLIICLTWETFSVCEPCIHCFLIYMLLSRIVFVLFRATTKHFGEWCRKKCSALLSILHRCQENTKSLR